MTGRALSISCLAVAGISVLRPLPLLYQSSKREARHIQIFLVFIYYKKSILQSYIETIDYNMDFRKSVGIASPTCQVYVLFL